MTVSAYILIQTEVGKAANVADQVRELTGVVSADDVTGCLLYTSDAADDL